MTHSLLFAPSELNTQSQRLISAIENYISNGSASLSSLENALGFTQGYLKGKLKGVPPTDDQMVEIDEFLAMIEQKSLNSLDIPEGEMYEYGRRICDVLLMLSGLAESYGNEDYRKNVRRSIFKLSTESEIVNPSQVESALSAYTGNNHFLSKFFPSDLALFDELDLELARALARSKVVDALSLGHEHFIMRVPAIEDLIKIVPQLKTFVVEELCHDEILSKITGYYLEEVLNGRKVVTDLSRACTVIANIITDNIFKDSLVKQSGLLTLRMQVDLLECIKPSGKELHPQTYTKTHTISGANLIGDAVIEFNNWLGEEGRKEINTIFSNPDKMNIIERLVNLAKVSKLSSPLELFLEVLSSRFETTKENLSDLISILKKILITLKYLPLELPRMIMQLKLTPEAQHTLLKAIITETKSPNSRLVFILNEKGNYLLDAIDPKIRAEVLAEIFEDSSPKLRVSWENRLELR